VHCFRKEHEIPRRERLAGRTAVFPHGPTRCLSSTMRLSPTRSPTRSSRGPVRSSRRRSKSSARGAAKPGRRVWSAMPAIRCCERSVRRDQPAVGAEGRPRDAACMRRDPPDLGV
jgi:hypothetical protein